MTGRPGTTADMRRSRGGPGSLPGPPRLTAFPAYGCQPAKQSGWPPVKAKQETWREVVPVRPPRSVTVGCAV